MDERRKKLRFRAWRRGFREIDLILGRFADAHLAGLDKAGLDALEALLDAPDQLVYDWIAGLSPAPAAFDTPTLASLRAFVAGEQSEHDRAELSAPSPLAGEGREGGDDADISGRRAHTPTPNPSPQGGGGAINPLPEQFGSTGGLAPSGERPSPLVTPSPQGGINPDTEQNPRPSGSL